LHWSHLEGERSSGFAQLRAAKRSEKVRNLMGVELAHVVGSNSSRIETLRWKGRRRSLVRADGSE